MPTSISLICIRNTKAEEFIKSDQYLDLKEDIFLQRNESDALYLAMSLSRGGYSDAVSGLDENDYLYIKVDDEDDFAIQGSFIPSGDVGLVTNMSIVATHVKKKKLRDYLEYYNYEFLSKLEKDVVEELRVLAFNEDGEFRNLSNDDVRKIEAICPNYDWDYAEQKWAFFELGFDTSLSTGSNFILRFSPSLRNLIKWKSIIDDEIDEWQNEYEDREDKFAYSLDITSNHTLLELLQEKLGLGEGLEGLRNYPSIIFFGMLGNSQVGWEEQ